MISRVSSVLFIFRINPQNPQAVLPTMSVTSGVMVIYLPWIATLSPSKREALQLITVKEVINRLLEGLLHENS